MARWAPLRLWAPPAVLAALTIWLGFQAGGFFARSVGIAAVVLAIMMLARLVVVHRPLEGVGRPLTLAIVAMLALFAWTLASAQWSDAAFRALVQADRVLLYALALIFFGSWARSHERLSVMLRAAVLACVVLCAAGLISRLIPDVWTLGVEQRSNRLQYPLTYANSMGLLAALGLLWSFALAASARESRLMRALAAAVVPITAATLVLTYSRASIGAAIVGLLALLVLQRSRALASAAVAVAAPVAVAVAATYRADLLATADFTSPAAIEQGHGVGLVLVASAAGAALLRAALFDNDARVVPARIAPRTRRAVLVALTSVVVLAIAGLAITSDVPRELSQRHERLREPSSATTDVRDRLTDPGSSERVDAWRVALQDFRSAPVHGRGAGTFVLSWNERRPQYLPFNETHSLFLQMLGELGVVGLLLIVLAVAMILIVAARRSRGPEGSLHAAVFAGGLTWALAAAVDWQWQMPVVTLSVFALGGAGLAAWGAERSPGAATGWPARLALALAIVIVAVLPARVALSERAVRQVVGDFKLKDCGRVAPAARDALALVGARPEPHEILAYCATIAGDHSRAVREAARAVELDPANWRYHYALALVRGAAGLDPRAQVNVASDLNQLEPLVYKARVRFVGTDPAAWRRQAARSPIAFDDAP